MGNTCSSRPRMGIGGADCWQGLSKVGSKLLCGSDAAAVVSSTVTNDPTHVDIHSFSTPKKLLGLGGFGCVRAVKKLTGRDRNTNYALKSLSKHAVLQRSSGVSSVLSELKALALLADAPFVCNVHYAFQDECFLYMVLDLAVGGDMRYNLKCAPYYRFSEHRARFYIAQVLLAVEACHQASILHRDVKPENILLKENGYVVLSDFGVAKLLDKIEDCRSTSGTHGYMAPEIYFPQHRHGTPADWFAVGVTLHEFVCGRRPFETSKLQAFRYEPLNASDLALSFLQSCRFLSDNCKDFITGLLVLKASRRLGSHRGVDEMKQHEWFAGFDWSAVKNQFAVPPCRPDISFDRTDVRSDAIKQAVTAHLLSPPVPASDQHVFERYEYHRRYYTASSGIGGEGGMNPLLLKPTNGETKVTMSLSASPPPTHTAGTTNAAASAAASSALRFSPPRRSRLDPPSHHHNDPPPNPYNDNTTSRPRPLHNHLIEQQQAPADTPSHPRNNAPAQSAHLDKTPIGPVNLTGPFPVKSSLAEPARSPNGSHHHGLTHPVNEASTTMSKPVPAMTQRPMTLAMSSMASFHWQAKRPHNNPHGGTNASAAAVATTSASSLIASHGTPAWQQQRVSDRQSATYPSRRSLLQRGVGSRSLGADNGSGAGMGLEHRYEQPGGGESSHRYEEQDEGKHVWAASASQSFGEKESKQEDDAPHSGQGLGPGLGLSTGGDSTSALVTGSTSKSLMSGGQHQGRTLPLPCSSGGNLPAHSTAAGPSAYYRQETSPMDCDNHHNHQQESLNPHSSHTLSTSPKGGKDTLSPKGRVRFGISPSNPHPPSQSLLQRQPDRSQDLHVAMQAQTHALMPSEMPFKRPPPLQVTPRTSPMMPSIRPSPLEHGLGQGLEHEHASEWPEHMLSSQSCPLEPSAEDDDIIIMAPSAAVAAGQENTAKHHRSVVEMGGPVVGGAPVGGKIVEWGDDDADASVSVLSSSRSEENLNGL